MQLGQSLLLYVTKIEKIIFPSGHWLGRQTIFGAVVVAQLTARFQY